MVAIPFPLRLEFFKLKAGSHPIKSNSRLGKKGEILRSRRRICEKI
jgi:hypothetical protein